MKSNELPLNDQTSPPTPIIAFLSLRVALFLTEKNQAKQWASARLEMARDGGLSDVTSCQDVTSEKPHSLFGTYFVVLDQAFFLVIAHIVHCRSSVFFSSL